MTACNQLFLKLLATLLALGGLACGAPVERGVAGGAAGEAGEPKRHVVLILLDAARADRFSCWGYPKPTTPEMDRLAANGVLFFNHFSQATDTRPSIPSLLYSRYFTPPLFPNDPRVPYSSPGELFLKPDPEQISLPKVFEGAGFATAAISGHLWMGEQTAFADEFQELRDLTRRHSSKKYPYPRAREVVDEAIEWIGQNRDRDTFLYLHLMDTHYPHYFEEEAQELFGAARYDSRRFRESGGPNVPIEALTPEDLDYVDALYDGGLRHADRHLGRLFDFLRMAGLLDRTTIAITSDHGEYLRDGRDGRPRTGKTVFAHGGPGFDPLLRIPLLLYSPEHLEPARYDGFSEEVDVAPTLLRLAGVRLPAGKRFDGVDLQALITGQAEPKPHVVMRQTLRTGTYKVLFTTPDRRLLGDQAPEIGAVTGRLFDLVEDPWESTDRFQQNPEVVADLLRRYRETLRAPFQRAQKARSGEQPKAGFAISARHALTRAPLRRVRRGSIPEGWSLVPGEPHSALVANRTDEPLEIHFAVPNGDYQLSFGLVGAAAIEVDGRVEQIVSERNMAAFGGINVSGETFRARITPRAEVGLRIFFFGFVPSTAVADEAEDAERLNKLRSLGYVQ